MRISDWSSDVCSSDLGGVGALAFACGTTELEHVLATQTMAFVRPQTMRVTLTGTLKPGVTAKDVILRINAQLGVDVARGRSEKGRVGEEWVSTGRFRRSR